jgi:hypothetical protein
VTIHALSLMPPMVYWADADLGRRLARVVNDPVGALTGVEGLSPGDQARILGGNARRLLGLD